MPTTFIFSLFEKFFINRCSSRHGLHQVAKKFTKVISFPNTSSEINFSFFNRDSVLNLGISLFIKLEGISEGFLSIINK